MYRYTISLFFLVSFLCAFAQVDLDKVVNFPNTEDLNSTIIKKITEGPFGFIWIASADGLFRFDGSLLYLVYDGDFEDIDIDQFNERFVFTSRTNVIFHSFSEDTTIVIPKGSLMEGDYILQAMTITADTTYWIVSTFGITKFHTETGKEMSMQIFDSQNRSVEVTAVAGDPKNKNLLWLGTKSGLFSYNVETQHYKQYWLRNKYRRDRERELNSIDALYVHSNGEIYCGSWGAGVAIFDPVSGENNHFVHELGDGNISHVYSIIPESDSIIWISSTTGCVRYNVHTKEMNSFLSSKVIDDNVLDIGPVMIDNKGKYWIGYLHGLRMLDPHTSKIEIVECPIMTNDKNYIPRSVTIGKNPNLLYMAVEYSDGLYTYNLKSKKWNCIKIKSPGTVWDFDAWATHWQTDTLWILEAEGLYYYIENDQFLKKSPIIPDHNRYRFTSFAWVTNDNVWLSSRQRGLYILDIEHGEFKHYSQIDYFSNQGFLDRLKFVHLDSKGRVWLCSKNQLHIYYPKDSLFIDLSSQVNNEAPFLDIYSITEDANHIWISTGTGVYMIQHQDGTRINSIRVSDISTNSIVSDGIQYLWMITSSSIIKKNVLNGTSQIFTETSGLPKTGRYGYEKIDIILDNQIILAGRKIFTLFHPKELKTTVEKPIPYIVSVSVDGIEAKHGGLEQSLNYLSIEPDQNSITIDFSAISYSSQISNQFRYMLKGINNEWVTSSGEKVGPTYVNLNAGEYRFLVEVRSNNEYWSEPAILEIKVGEYWWQNFWVHLLVALMGFGALIKIYQFRVNRIRKSSEVQLHIMNLEKKALQAQMNPHFIFNAMNSIQHFMIKKDEKNAMFYLNSFGKLLRSILNNSSKSYVSLKSELEIIENYIILESLRFEDSFQYQIIVDPSLDYNDIKIPGFVIQPIVENAIKHGLVPKSRGGNLQIILEQNNGMVCCIIEDNGVGRSYKKTSPAKHGQSSMGLKILRSRLKMYNPGLADEVFVIEDLYSDNGTPSGTRVTIKLPIQTR